MECGPGSKAADRAFSTLCPFVTAAGVKDPESITAASVFGPVTWAYDLAEESVRLLQSPGHGVFGFPDKTRYAEEVSGFPDLDNSGRGVAEEVCFC